MGRELDEILRQQVVQPANSCVSGNGVSFLDQVIRPLYEVVAAVCLYMILLYIYTLALLLFHFMTK